MQQSKKRGENYIETTHKNSDFAEVLSEKGECIYCNRINTLYNGICEKCLLECYNTKTGLSFINYQTAHIKKFFRYSFRKELYQLYYEANRKKFRIKEKKAQSFLKEYCMADKECFADYILRTKKM